MTTVTGLPLRELRADDAGAIIDLISGVYREYPGCVLDLAGVDDDLPDLAVRLSAAGGQGWVVTDNEKVVACVGVTPAQVDGEAGAQLKRLYVAASHRRRGLGQRLVRVVEEHARTVLDVRVVDLWSDTRFADAHRLYERCGYTATGETRQLHDPSNTTEYRFVRWLADSA